MYSPPVSLPILRQAIGAERGVRVDIEDMFPVAGGCINETFAIRSSAGAFFVKSNHPEHADTFAAEAAGLEALASARAVRVPQVVCTGHDERSAFLVLEYLTLEPLTEQATATLGHALADLHRHHAAHFGWLRDNVLGATPQPNGPLAAWPEFWRCRRLQHQLRLAADNGYTGRLQSLGDTLLAALPVFFSTYTPCPSLLHGDLWSGNAAATAGAVPVIYDPAVYYGDRETDIAMTQLFGGFSTRFYAAYNESWPLDSGYGVRRELYNLYHVLNHLNLFGGGYLRQAEGMLERLVSQT